MDWILYYIEYHLNSSWILFQNWTDNSRKMLMNSQEHMYESVCSQVGTFIGIPNNIIQQKAEETSERYVADLALEGEEREQTKQAYKEMFVEEIISRITY